MYNLLMNQTYNFEVEWLGQMPYVQPLRLGYGFVYLYANLGLQREEGLTTLILFRCFRSECGCRFSGSDGAA